MFALSTGALHLYCHVILYVQSIISTTYQQQMLNMSGLCGLLLKSMWAQHLEWWGHIDTWLMTHRVHLYKQPV